MDRHRLQERLAVDVRALAALRVSVGLLVLADLTLRVFDLPAFYTDAGTWPRALAVAGWMPHGWSGGLLWAAFLFAFAAAAGASLALGYHTRAATAVSFVLLLSLQLRNTSILNSGDVLLLATLLWGLFLPWGAAWSLDAGRGQTGKVVGIATAALLVQPVLVYATNAVFKARSGLWGSGEAMRYAFVDTHTTRFGSWLAAEAPLEAMGQAWFLLVLVAPLLLALRGHSRGALAAALAGGHLAMLLTMRIGLFPLVSIAVLLPFVPSKWWDLAARRAPEAAQSSHAPRVPRVQRVPLVQRVPRVQRASRARPVLPGAWSAPLLVANLLLSALVLGLVPTGPLDEALEGRDRTWAMFANPARTESWYATPVTLASGIEADVLHGSPPWDRPHDLGPAPEIRWRKYLARLDQENDPALEQAFGAYLCTHWSRSHDEPPLRIDWVRIERPGPHAPAARLPLATFTCPQP